MVVAVTKTNQRIEEPAVREDGGKLRFDLLPVRPLEEMVAVLSHGADKYGDDNWRKGMSWSRHYAAIMRHCWKWFGGQSIDPDSGLHHLAHAAVSCMFLMEYMWERIGTDDRRKRTDGKTVTSVRKLDEAVDSTPITKANTYGY